MIYKMEAEAPINTDMGEHPVKADRIADKAIFTMALMHLVAGIFFVVTLISTAATLSGDAAADEILACEGENLVHQLQEENPTKLAEISAAAEEFSNGEAILWKITREGSEPSWLFGTMHSADKRILAMMDKIRPQFETASTVIIENTDTIEGKKPGANLALLKQYAFLDAGTTLDSLVADAELPLLKKELASRRMAWASARHMQPWLITASIGIPVCDLQAKAKGGAVLDTVIGKTAKDQGKTVIGLETAEEQFKAVSSIPFEFHVNALNETLKLSHLSSDLMETTKYLYLEGKPGWMLPLVRSFAPKTYTGKGYTEFQKLLLTNRNLLMAERAAEHLEKGNVFMAVGGLHLPGDEGLVELLRKAGYTLEPISL
ncbi:MAG: TraB/GumN family protein [Rhizobiaceae bacterium]